MRIDHTTSLWLDRDLPRSSDALDPGTVYDTVVAGAGITGMVTAVLLARLGQRVAVVEARTLGAVTTGNTTGKISLLQGTQLSKISRHHPASLVGAYLDGNRAGQQWLIDYCTGGSVPVEYATAYSYAGTSDGTDLAYAEFQTAERLDLPVRWTTDVPLPFETFGAAALDDQAQFDPLDLLVALAAELRSLGGVLVEGVRVTGVDTGDPCTVETDAADIRCSAVVLATGVPILDRALYFAKVTAKRSYALAFTAPGPLPDGMFLSVDEPSRSIRTAQRADGVSLVIGGNGHDVGRADSPLALVDDLEQWTGRMFPGAEVTHTWSAQDYESANRIPFVGWLPRGRGRIFMATGYDKWGMTNGVAAALNLADQVTGADPRGWAKKLGHRMTVPADLAQGAKENAIVGAELTGGWLKAGVRSLPDEAPDDGVGVVGRRGIAPVAVSTVEGRTCALSAVCPHLGGIVAWNDAELTWDCPLHGSRFDADGTLLEGPATTGLTPAD